MPQSNVVVYGKKHGFDKDIVRAYAAAGQSVSQLLSGFPDGLDVYVNNVLLSDEEYETTGLKAGDHVVISGHVGDDIVDLVLSIAILYFFNWAGAEIIEAYELTGAAATLVTAGSTLVGSLAVNALITPEIPDLSGDFDTAIPTYSLTGTRNRAAPFSVIPKVHGTTRYYPPLAAAPFTEIVGDNQYLTMLFNLGYGPKLRFGDLVASSANTLLQSHDIDASLIQIGKTNIREFSDLRFQIGTIDNITLFNDTVIEENPGVTLNHGSTSGQSNGWYSDGQDEVRTTPAEAEEIVIDLTFPKGVWDARDDGSAGAVSTRWRIEYRKVGESGWIRETDGWFLPGPVVTETVTVDDYSSYDGYTATYEYTETNFPSGAQKEVYRASYRIRNLEKAFYEVRLTRLRTYVGTGRHHFSDATWSAFRAISHSQPWNSNDHILMALRIRATEQLNGVIDQLSVKPTAVINGWARTNLMPSSALSNFRGWNSTDGYTTSTTVTDGFERVARNGATIENTKFVTEEDITTVPGESYVQEFLVRLDPGEVLTSVDVNFRVNGSADNVVPAAVTRLDYDLFRVRGEYTAQFDELTIAAIDIRNIVTEDDGWTYISVKGLRFFAESTEGIGELQDTSELSNPAWCYYDSLTGTQVREPVSDDRINLTELRKWADWCEANSITFDYVHDGKETVLDRCKKIAASGFASWAMQDSKFSVVSDTYAGDSVQVISPRNSKSFKMTRKYVDLPHGVKVRYTDDNTDEQDEIIAYRDGYSAGNATKFEELTPVGVNSQQQAWKYGRYHFRQAILRPETYKVVMDFENLITPRGGEIWVAHDSILVGIKWGRVSSIIRTGDGIVGIVSDEELPMEAGKSYCVRIRTVTGLTLERVDLSVGVNTELTFTNGPLSSDINENDLFLFGEWGEESIECKVQKINVRPDFSAEVTLVPAVSDMTQWGEAAAYDPHITKPIDITKIKPDTPVIENIESGTSVLYRDTDGSVNSSIVIAFGLSSSNYYIGTVNVRYRISGDTSWRYISNDLTNGNTVARLFGVEDLAEYEIGIRVGTIYNVWSDWSGTTVHQVVGKTEEPNDVEGFSATAQSDRVLLSWNHIPDLDRSEYEVRVGGSDWDSAATVAATDGTSLEYRGSGNLVFRIKAVDTSGNESENATSVYLYVTEPSVSSISAEIIDNNVLLRWSSSVGTFAISHFDIVRGASFGSPDKDFGSVDSTFAALFEQQAGTYTYWVRPVDAAGNVGDAVSTTAVVNSPPDYILRNDYDSDFSGTLTNMVALSVGILGPVNTTETWAQHFSNNSWADIQDQIDAGYPYYAQPTVSSGSYQETIDYGTTLPASKVTIAVTATILDGTSSISTQIETSTNGSDWTDYGGSSEIYSQEFRYVRFTVTVASSGGDDLHYIERINIKVATKLKTDSGSGTVPSLTSTSALSLDDTTSDYVSIGTFNYASGATVSNLTVLCWVKCADSADNYLTIASFDRDLFWRLQVGDYDATSNAGEGVFSFLGSDDSIYDIHSGIAINDGDWHFIAARFAAGVVSIYIDGKFYTETVSGVSTIGYSSNTTVRYGFIGAGSEASSDNGTRGGGNYFNGYIDDFRLYHRALTDAEIQGLFERTAEPATTSLILDYDFDEGTGTTANDDSGNNYDGTLRASATWETSDVPPVGVEFNIEFIDVDSITLGAGGSAFLTPIYGFNDIPDPGGFMVYLFDSSGNRASGSFSWSARGV